INALRGDTNECVRLEAALALGSGCCCNKRTIAALNITVSGSNKDGKPSENSERVKAAATYALQHCLACFSEIEVVTEPKTPIEPPTPAPPPVPVEKPTAKIGSPPSNYYQAVEKMSLKQVVEEARRTMSEVNKTPAVAAVHRSEADYSLYGM